MTTETAIAKLAKNCLDETALVEVYRNNRQEIDQAIAEWFGTGTIVSDVLSRVLVEISRCAPQFQPKDQTAKDFIVDCVRLECRNVYEETSFIMARSNFSN